MARSLWSGDITFGIVSIPVQMHAAVKEHTLHFHQISRSEHRRIRYKKVADGSDEEIHSDDIVHGYELKDGQYVILEDDELQRLAAHKSKDIEIREFVRLDEIDPRYFDHPYYLLPAEKALRPYRLLVEALAKADRVGIAQMVMHNKEHLVAIRSLAGALCLETMHFRDELIEPTPFSKSASKIATVQAKELDMAARLIDSMTTHFDPSSYHDDYHQRLLDYIARKGRGKPFLLDEPEKTPTTGKVIDLMDALRKSLERTGKKTAIERTSDNTNKSPKRTMRKRTG